jgi:4-amino-4-deoxychorismate lyase
VIPGPSIASADRGLAYGDGLFETLRVVAGQAPLAARHAERMTRGAACLGIPFHKYQFDQTLAALLSEHRGEDGIAKLMLTRGAGGRGYRPPARPELSLISRWHDSVDRSRQAEQGLSLALADVRLSDQPALAGLKHLNRLEQVLAWYRAAAPDVDELLMQDAAGRPLELASMNLFIVSAGEIWTPPLDRAGVAGVMRGLILETLAAQIGVPVREKRFSFSQLHAADEVFAANSVAGVLPVRKLALWSWPVGAITRRLQAAAEELF